MLKSPAGTVALAFQKVGELPGATWPDGPVPQQLHLDTADSEIDGHVLETGELFDSREAALLAVSGGGESALGYLGEKSYLIWRVGFGTKGPQLDRVVPFQRP